jgi:hypothetical protein
MSSAAVATTAHTPRI